MEASGPESPKVGCAGPCLLLGTPTSGWERCQPPSFPGMRPCVQRGGQSMHTCTRRHTPIWDTGPLAGVDSGGEGLSSS